ncbi:MAG: DNA-packaging protein, partial [Variibacter sp.]|nr:DNA-packaging protein [Variibacter sp.]
MTTTCPETSTTSVASLHDASTRLSQAALTLELLTRLTPPTAERWSHDWPFFAHAHQLAPAQAQGGGEWTTWLLMGGRGAGKTRAGAEWVRAQVEAAALAAAPAPLRIALIGQNAHEVREVMVEGVSGLLGVHPARARPDWQPSRRRLEWPCGAVAHTFSADDPESLRGSQFHLAWADEFAKWRYAEAAFDMLQFGLRLGAHPRA